MDLKPNWLSICIGANDVWRQFDSPAITNKHIMPDVYKKMLTNLVQQAKPVTKGIILMTPYYMEPLKQDCMRAKMDEYGAIVKEIATEHNTMFVDLQAVFDEYLQYRHSSYLSWDRVHPNNVGCMLIAQAFLKAVGFDKTFL
jgi:lysophospholipase L1-like esterase